MNTSWSWLLLREAGFDIVVVTGKTGDSVDGLGILLTAIATQIGLPIPTPP